MKIGEFTASLYDLFGYLLPGIVTVVGVALCVSATVDLAVARDPFAAAVLLLICYLTGHAVQALGNQWLGKGSTRLAFSKLPHAVQREVCERLADTFGPTYPDPVHGTDEDVESAWGFIDESRVLGSQPNERDVYIYREGFYRGGVFAFVLLALGCMFRAVGGSVTIAWDPETPPLSLGPLLCSTGAVLSFVMAYLYRERLQRFVRYRIERGVYYWLALATKDDRSAKS